MEKKEPKIRSASYLNMIAIADDCDEKKIQEFRESLSEFGKEVFDMIDEEKKFSVVALGQMTKEELDHLKSISREYGNDHLVFFHNFRNILAVLEVCRMDVDEVLEVTKKTINK